MSNNYILIQWPEVQELMDEWWFQDEAILNIRDDDSSYLIPEDRIIDNDYILRRSEELAVQLKSTNEEEQLLMVEWEHSFPFEGGMNTFESVLNLKLLLLEP